MPWFLPMKNKIVIATRESPLALYQARHVAALLKQQHPQIKVELLKLTTRGDKLLDSPLAKIGGKGLFIKELEHALLENRADIAVHSMKDIPVKLPTGLSINAVLQREDPSDAFVSNKYQNLQQMPPAAVVGTSSLRRQSQILAHYPQLKIKFLRGNVNSRLQKLDKGEYDAIILASAGLKRLGFASRIKSCLSYKQCLPAVGQGIIGVECKTSDALVVDLIAPLNHLQTAICLAAERAVNNGLNGGCQVPIAAHASYSDTNELKLEAMVGSEDGKTLLKVESSIQNPNETNATQLGDKLARQLLKKGAAKILQQLYS